MKRSEEIQTRIDTIANVLGSVGWKTEVIPIVADRLANHLKNLIAVKRDPSLDDRLRGSIDEDNWFILMLDQRLKELQADKKQALNEEAEKEAEDNPPAPDGPPKPY